MPDDRILHTSPTTSESLKEIVPPVLIMLGALSLIRSSRLLGLAAAGAWLYDAAQKVDADRRRRGVDLPSRRRDSKRVDDEIADSFPASDPPSFSGMTAGTP
jgi:hypothetical protein